MTETRPPEASPPSAPTEHHVVTSPHGDRVDPYYWLRDDTRSSAKVLDYLKAENAWYERHAGRYTGLSDQLFAEIKGRIKQDDASVPYRSRGYLYNTRYEEGKEYPIYCRRKDLPDAPEEVLLNVNTMAAGHDYYQAIPAGISLSQNLMAYAEDESGRRQYRLRFKNLATGALYPDVLEGTNGQAVWAHDEKTIFYVENDPESLRSFRVRRHKLGTGQQDDVTIRDELDESYYTSVGMTGSDEYILIQYSSTVSDEALALRADEPDGEFRVIAPRARDFLYDCDHIRGRWVVRTDWDAPNFRLMQFRDGELGSRDTWRDLIGHSQDVFINGYTLFNNYLVVDERSAGLRRLRIQAWDVQGEAQGAASYVRSDEPAYIMSLSVNAEQDSETLRYTYSSLTTPTITYDVNMRSAERTLLKQQPVLGGFDSAHFVTERVWVTARDGVKVPVSLAYHRNTPRDGRAPLLQYGYGSYGICIDPGFTSTIVSLLERGFVYAIAHIRGGEDMGRSWYEDGKKLKKRNSFNDFTDITEALVKLGYAARDKVFAHGGSAGGLLMGAIVNARPDLYRGILADVPFVDVVTTMLDESIPLTTNEFDEWGDPKQKVAYDYMLSYSPYDNVSAQAYPAMLIATGLHDSQVQYFEPAKWVAKLRAVGTGSQPILFRTNMEAGHGGKSGRFRRLQEIAEQYAFLIDLLATGGHAAG